MPAARIRGTHLNTSREFAEMQERIAAGHNILPPTIIPMEDVPGTPVCGKPACRR